jgi:hypothetical protein
MIPEERGKRFNEILRVNRLTLEDRLVFFDLTLPLRRVLISSHLSMLY